MTRNKIFSFVLIFAMAAALFAAIPASIAQAATGTLGSGTILSISLVKNPKTSKATGLVTLLDEAGATQKISISLETAITMELVIPNAKMVGKDVVIKDPLNPKMVLTSGVVDSLVFVTDSLTKISSLKVTLTDASDVEQVVSLNLSKALSLDLISPNLEKFTTSIVIDPADILKSTTDVKGITTLETYFGTALGVTGDELAAYKAAGFGYGEIAQACWMATQLSGDAALLDQILMAKQSGDFSGLVLPDGATANNWGQLRKAVLTDPHQNLGQIMSGHATPLAITTPTETPEPLMSTQGSNHAHGNGHGHGKGGKK